MPNEVKPPVEMEKLTCSKGHVSKCPSCIRKHRYDNDPEYREYRKKVSKKYWEQNK